MKKTLLLPLSLTALAGLLGAQALDEVLARNYQAHGGLEKLKSLTSWKLTGRIVIPVQGLEMPLVMWQKAPDKLRVESTFQGKKIVQAFDGRKAWWIMPFLSEEAQEMTGEQGKAFSEQADFESPLVVYKEKGYRLELQGREEMAGTPVFKLKLTRTDGREIYFFLDGESGIERKSAQVMKVGEAESLIEILYGDYRPVDGHVMPFAIENRMNGQTQMKMTVESIEINPSLEDAFFAMPAAKPAPATEPVK